MQVPPGRGPGAAAPAGDRGRGRPGGRPARDRWRSCRPGRAGSSPRPASTPPTSRRTRWCSCPRTATPRRARCAARLRELLGVDVAVVISDTFGRTWREGLTDVAVGAAGVPALIDHRGAVDGFGNRLETTRTALVDELASAADLVKGKLGGVPVAVIRGLDAERPEPDTGTRPLVRLPADDLFPYGARDLVGAREPGGRPRPPGRRARGRRRRVPASPAPRSRSSRWCCATAARTTAWSTSTSPTP